jgi:hypothetical protein
VPGRGSVSEARGPIPRAETSPFPRGYTVKKYSIKTVDLKTLLKGTDINLRKYTVIKNHTFHLFGIPNPRISNIFLMVPKSSPPLDEGSHCSKSLIYINKSSVEHFLSRFHPTLYSSPTMVRGSQKRNRVRA